MSEKKKSQWFEAWFDSPYYHLLYQNRDESEAALFLTHLMEKLQLPTNAKVWDMACGKGRHVKFLMGKGFAALGSDLSENSVRLAISSDFQPISSSHFYVHDMREPIRINYFDCVLNVFTSIGYFNDNQDNQRVFLSAAKTLKKGGYFVLDFFNADKVVRELVDKEKKIMGRVEFDIHRSIEDRTIIKKIRIKDGETEFSFEERVQLLRQEDFSQYAAEAGLQALFTFGNYKLSAFDNQTSDRLIMIFSKT